MTATKTAKTAKKPANAMAQVAQTLEAAPVQAPATKPSLPRGCPSRIRLGETAYKSKAAHTVARWERIMKACVAGGGTADVLPLVAECGPGANAHNYEGPGVPGHFITYCLRRGYILEVK